MNPRAVILDLSMPVMNGLRAAREITRIASNLQIEMVTMHTSEQLRQDANDADVKDVVSKPDRTREHWLASRSLRSVYAAR